MKKNISYRQDLEFFSVLKIILHSRSFGDNHGLHVKLPTFVSLSSTYAHVDIKSSDPTFAALITPCTHVHTKLCDPTFALLSYTCAHVHIKWHSKQEVGEYSIKKEAAWKTVFHRGMTAGINVLLTFGANVLSDCL